MDRSQNLSSGGCDRDGDTGGDVDRGDAEGVCVVNRLLGLQDIVPAEQPKQGQWKNEVVGKCGDFTPDLVEALEQWKQMPTPDYHGPCYIMTLDQYKRWKKEGLI